VILGDQGNYLVAFASPSKNRRAAQNTSKHQCAGNHNANLCH
jgi:hypothetical protein